MMNKAGKKAAVVLTVMAMTVSGGVISANAYDGFGQRSQAEIEQELSGYSELWTCMVDVANVRRGPSESSDIIGSLSYGDVIEVSNYTENGWIGLSFGGYVRGDLLENGIVYVEGEMPSYNTGYTETTSYNTYGNQPTAEIDTVVYPRVDRHLSNGTRATWCSLNTDGYYYNENSERFADNGNGTFSDVYGNVYSVIG